MAGVDEDVVAWRRHLHRNPEVSFEEHETSAFVADTLEGFGLEVERPTETSVMARLGSGGPVVALRADIDALPIHEESGVEFESERPGAMHACGHDGHTAMLLGAARELSGRRVRRRGPVHLPARRGTRARRRARPRRGGRDGGRRLHLRLPPVDAARVRQGRRDAGAVHGRGRLLQGHDHAAAAGTAASPTPPIDTIAAASEFVGSLQHIVSRRADPLQPAVVTIGSFHAGDAPNVIPGRADLRGTTRSFDAALRERMPELIEEIGNGVCAAHGAEFELDFTFGYKPVVNDERATGLVRDVVSDELFELDPIMGGDDFSAYLAEAPGCYAFVGAGGEYPHHHPRFVIDERALAIGTRLHVHVALRALEVFA